MKKKLSSLLTVLLFLCLMGCRLFIKPEPTVTAFCDALKALDLTTASTCFVSGESAIQNPYTEENIANQDVFTEQTVGYLENCAKEMTYVLGEAGISGNTAVIPVTFTYTDAGPVLLDALQEYLTQAFELAFSGGTADEIEALFGTVFAEKLESAEMETATVTIEFECVKTDDAWKMQALSDEAQYEISNMLSCNLLKTVEAYEEISD